MRGPGLVQHQSIAEIARSCDLSGHPRDMWARESAGLLAGDRCQDNGEQSCIQLFIMGQYDL